MKKLILLTSVLVILSTSLSHSQEISDYRLAFEECYQALILSEKRIVELKEENHDLRIDLLTSLEARKEDKDRLIGELNSKYNWVESYEQLKKIKKNEKRIFALFDGGLAFKGNGYMPLFKGSLNVRIPYLKKVYLFGESGYFDGIFGSIGIRYLLD